MKFRSLAVLLLVVILLQPMPAKAQTNLVKSIHVEIVLPEGYDVYVASDNSWLSGWNRERFAMLAQRNGLDDLKAEGWILSNHDYIPFDNWVTMRLIDLEIAFVGNYPEGHIAGYVQYGSGSVIEDNGDDSAEIDYVGQLFKRTVFGNANSEIIAGIDAEGRRIFYNWAEFVRPNGIRFLIILAYYPDTGDIVTVYANAPMQLWTSDAEEEILDALISAQPIPSEKRPTGPGGAM